MKIKKYKKSEKGFAIVLALLLLVVMSLMGATLVIVVSSDHKQNSLKDSNQQTFYAAETGIQEAKDWLQKQSDAETLLKGGNPTLVFCKTLLFPNLNSVQAMKSSSSGKNYHVGTNTLDQVIDAQSDEKERLKKYSYEYFIAYTPDANGNTSTLKTKTVTGLVGSSIAEGTSYKAGGTSMATYYTIFSCGKGENDTIVPLEAVVTLVQ